MFRIHRRQVGILLSAVRDAFIGRLPIGTGHETAIAQSVMEPFLPCGITGAFLFREKLGLIAGPPQVALSDGPIVAGQVAGT